MAKKTSRVIVILQAESGHQTYTTTVNRRNMSDKKGKGGQGGKLTLNKYNPVTRKVEVYKEVKVKKSK